MTTPTPERCETERYAGLERDSLLAILRLRDRQIETFRTYWLRDAKEALAGRPQALRNRVALAESPPMEIIQSAQPKPQEGA